MGAEGNRLGPAENVEVLRGKSGRKAGESKQ